MSSVSTNTKLVTSANLEATVGVFGELLTGDKFDDVTVEFIYPFLNTDFDLKQPTLTGTATAAATDGILVANSGSGTVLVSSKDSIRYRPGHTGFADFTFRETGTTGKGQAGCFDLVDGFYIGYDNDNSEWFVGRRRIGLDFVQTQSDGFNGNARINELDHTKINIFRILFGYLGVANPIFLVKQDDWRVLHILQTENRLETTTVSNPNFPISVYAENGAVAYSASWNGGVIGSGNVNAGARYFSVSKSGQLSGTDILTLGNFRNKTIYKGVQSKVKAQLLRYKFVVDPPASGTGVVDFKILKNATLTGTPSYVDVDTDNSVIEIDETATYASGGKELFTDFASYTSGAGNAATFGGESQLPANEFGLFLLPGEVATITAQNVAGSTNVTVRLIFNWIEFF